MCQFHDRAHNSLKTTLIFIGTCELAVIVKQPDNDR